MLALGKAKLLIKATSQIRMRKHNPVSLTTRKINNEISHMATLL